MKELKPVLVCFLLISANCFCQKLHNADDLNRFFSDMLDSINAKHIAWASELNNAEKTGSYLNVKVRRLEIEEMLDNYDKAVTETKDISGSANFKKTMMNYIAYEKNLVNSNYIPFESLKSTSSQSEKDRLEHSLEVAAQDEKTELDKVKKAQKEYGTKNSLEGVDDN